MTVFRCAAAWIDNAVSGPVDIVTDHGVITAIGPPDTTGDDQPESLPGLVFPGFADAHSHVFHRALRGRTHGADAQAGSFWTWRETMYALAGRLDPDSLHALALATYTELLCAGYTAVGEFHYLHHRPDGGRYDDPNAMGLAVTDAGAEAGIDVTLLDVAYLSSGFGKPTVGVQQRFSDGSIDAWADRVAALPSALRTGVAVHSVRAVPESALGSVAAAADGRVLHVHLSEQAAENEACLAATGRTPAALLHGAGVLGPRTSAVHATHLTAGDLGLLAGTGTTAVICPTTEADLADGLPSIAAMVDAGIRLACGGDQQVIVDPFAQARGIEYGERSATGRRGTMLPAALVGAATVNSHRSIGSPGGSIEIGAPADLVAVRTDSARTAGADPDQLVMVAAAADVAVVVRAGEVVATNGIHRRFGDPGEMLGASIARAWR
ncbi:formimidoylglutamate deiminase [Nakamurella lactea]|uniref:formimidoylglutamate deiminase n=1 Tax=Nakamurella lactea TaxID=459515 RepID=UPI00040CBA3E|nr:formimidoylglutamate deiminase [Nakamurella lactea]